MKITGLSAIKILCAAFLLTVNLYASLHANSGNSDGNVPKLDNSITVQYVKKNLKKSSPRLVYNSGNISLIKKKLKRDPVIRNMFEAIKLNAEEVMEQPLLERKKIGRRLLSTSREMLYRINMLEPVYIIEKDPKVLERINDEVVAVCNFSDWNPSHYLDVAEMSLAVAFALDWTAGALPKTTQNLAYDALVGKPGIEFESRFFW